MAKRLAGVRLKDPTRQEESREEVVREMLDSIYDYGLDDDPRCAGAYNSLLNKLKPLIVQDCSED